MNYYIDTEFLEGTQKEKFPINLFRKNTPPTIDLISIGIVAEDGREYYAISKDFNLKEAWSRFELKDDYDVNGDLVKNIKKVYWLRENVLKPIYYELIGKDINFHDYDKFFTYKSFKKLIKKHGKTNKQIAEEIKLFVVGDYNHSDLAGKSFYQAVSAKNNPPKFYAYYADYDWVGFCWLFGLMMDLPKGFPMYCNDLKQLMDEKINIFCESEIKSTSFELALKRLKEKHSDYPKQENEHNALADARWNKKLHGFLNNL